MKPKYELRPTMAETGDIRNIITCDRADAEQWSIYRIEDGEAEWLADVAEEKLAQEILTFIEERNL